MTPEVEAAIRRHGAAAYPHECCGALLARGGGIADALALPNTTDEGPRRRFLVGPADYRAAESRARTIGGELAGFYHSHPDHPARPSEYDRANAWPNLSYVILSVTGGASGELTSWRLREDRAAFEPEDVELTQEIR
jgi:proteasome lid subunit RPN8/RPN11